MIKTIFVFIACVSIAQAQTVSLEMAFDATGNRKIEKTTDEIRDAWLQMFANGSYKRFTALANIEQDTVFAKRWIKGIPVDSLNAALTSFSNSTMFAQIPDDEIEAQPFYERWPWGNEEKKKFVALRFTDMTRSRYDSIRTNSEQWQIPLQTLRDSLGFGSITLAQINNNVNIPAKVKTWAQNNILNLSGINGQTTLEELWNDSRVDKRIFRVLFNLAQFKIRARWLRRQ